MAIADPLCRWEQPGLGSPQARNYRHGNPQEAAERLHAGEKTCCPGRLQQLHPRPRLCEMLLSREQAGPPGHAAGSAARGSSTLPPCSSILLPPSAAWQVNKEGKQASQNKASSQARTCAAVPLCSADTAQNPRLRQGKDPRQEEEQVENTPGPSPSRT